MMRYVYFLTTMFSLGLTLLGCDSENPKESHIEDNSNIQEHSFIDSSTYSVRQTKADSLLVSFRNPDTVSEMDIIRLLHPEIDRLKTPFDISTIHLTKDSISLIRSSYMFDDFDIYKHLELGIILIKRTDNFHEEYVLVHTTRAPKSYVNELVSVCREHEAYLKNKLLKLVAPDSSIH